MFVVPSQILPVLDTRLERSPGVQAGADEALVDAPPELPPEPTELPPEPIEPPDELRVDPPVLPAAPPWSPPVDCGVPPVSLFPPDAGVAAHPPTNNIVKSVHRDSLGIENLLEIGGLAGSDRVFTGCHSFPSTPAMEG